jgi:hypothetical protein
MRFGPVIKPVAVIWASLLTAQISCNKDTGPQIIVDLADTTYVSGTGGPHSYLVYFFGLEFMDLQTVKDVHLQAFHSYSYDNKYLDYYSDEEVTKFYYLSDLPTDSIDVIVESEGFFPFKLPDLNESRWRELHLWSIYPKEIYVPGRIVLGFKERISPEGRSEFLAAKGLQKHVFKQMPIPSFYLLEGFNDDMHVLIIKELIFSVPVADATPDEYGQNY